MSELKPCPFCGSEQPQDSKDDGNVPYEFGMSRSCSSCSAAVNLGWNTRPIEDALTTRIAELEEAQRWIPVGERLPEGGHREFYEVACMYQDFGELALFSKGRWVIYEGENVYDVTKRVKFWRKRQYLPDEVIAILSKGETNPEVQE